MRDIVAADDASPYIIALLGLPRIVDSFASRPPQRLEEFLVGAADAVPSYGPVLECLSAWTPNAARPREQAAASSGLPVRRICELVQSNNIGLAVQTVESAYHHVRPADPAAAREAIGRMFPAASTEDLLPQVTDPSTALQLDLEVVREAVRTLPRLRAASFTGWTCDLVLQLATDGAEFLLALLALFNALLRGAAGPAELWSLDYVLPLEKRTGGYRPIVIGEIFPRILGRIVARLLSPVAAEFLAPLQWGIGIPGGTETVAHAVSMFFRASNAPGADTGIQTVDFSNAFNTLRRSVIDTEVAARFPELLPYFRFSYGRAIPLRGPDGIPMATSATGVRQGDPLGPLLFCLGLDRVLRDVAAVFPEVQMLGLLDDVTLLGPRASIEACFRELSERAAGVGLIVNERKSLRLRVASDDPGATRAEGTLVLGCAVGPDDFVARCTRERLEEYTTIVRPVLSLPSPVAMAILQAAINARPVFTARTTFTPLASGTYLVFDTKIDQCVSILAGANRPVLPRHAQILRALPQAKGGLAMPRISELAPFAFAASFTAASVALAQKCPLLVNQLHLRSQDLRPVMEFAHGIIPSHYTVSHADAEQMSNSLFVPRSWAPPADAEAAATEDEAAPAPEAPRQRVLTTALVASQEAELAQILAPSRAAKALVRSGSHKGSAWFLGAVRYPLLRPSHSALQVALASRLLLAPPLPVYSRCSSCAVIVSDEISCITHGLNCAALQGLRTSRHTLIRNALVEMLRKLFGGNAVAVEPRVGPAQLDIGVTLGLGIRYVDVSIVNPASSTAPASAGDVDDAAAVARAHDKRLRYADTLAAHGIDAAQALVPFVVETTGRFGPDAKAFLDDVALAARALDRERDSTGTITYFVDRIKYLLLEGNALLSRHAWATLEPLLTEQEAPVLDAPIPEAPFLAPQ